MILKDLLLRGAVVASILSLAACGGSSTDSSSSDASSASPSATAVQTHGSMQLSSSNYQVPAASANALITVNRSGTATGTATVAYTTANGSAVAGTDYEPTSGTLKWEDGDTAPKSFAVNLKSRGKAFQVTLSSASGDASLGNPAAATVQTGSTTSSSSSGSSSGASSTSSSSSSGATSSSSGASSSNSGTSSSSGSTSTTSKQALLSYLTGLSSTTNAKKHLLIGQHTNYWVDGATAHMANVTALTSQTGQSPAILGTTIDMLYSDEDGVALSNAWIAKGGIVQVSWWGGMLVGDKTATPNLADLLDPSTQSYKNWYATLDIVAAQLKQINGPVLFRPFLEMNGGWYWWGNQNSAQFIQAWKNMHDYLVNTKGVTNLLWVYCVNQETGNYTTYYPGSSYADVVAIDAYPPGAAGVATYNALVPLNKPMIFAEAAPGWIDDSTQSFALDDSAMLQQVLTAYPKVVALIDWEGQGSLANQNGAQQVMNSSSVITLADLPSGL